MYKTVPFLNPFSEIKPLEAKNNVYVMPEAKIALKIRDIAFFGRETSETYQNIKLLLVLLLVQQHAQVHNIFTIKHDIIEKKMHPCIT